MMHQLTADSLQQTVSLRRAVNCRLFTVGSADWKGADS
jgi:hypothetical protein